MECEPLLAAFFCALAAARPDIAADRPVDWLQTLHMTAVLCATSQACRVITRFDIDLAPPPHATPHTKSRPLVVPARFA